MVEKIIMIVNLSLWGLLILSLLFGFLRGFRRNVSRLIATIVSIILAFIFTGIVSKLLGVINIGGIVGDGTNKTVLDFLIELVCENLGIETLAADSAIRELVGSLAEAILRLPAYLILLLICLFIIRPILSLIFRKIFVFLNFKGIGMRFAGMGIALVTHALVFFFTTSIIFGAKGILQQVLTITNQVDETPNGEVSSETSEIEAILECIDNQSYIKIVNTLSGKNNKVQANFLGHMVRIKTSNGTINISKEISNVEPLIPLLLKLEDDNLIGYILENRNSIIEVFEKSEILNIVMPPLFEVIEITMPEVNIDFEQLKEIDWKEEKENILHVVESVMDLLYESEFDFENPKEILGNTKLSYYLGEIGKTLDQSKLIKEVLFTYLNDILQDSLKTSLPEEIQPLLNVLDLTKIDLTNDLTIVGNVLNNLYALKILDGEEIDFIGEREAVVNLIKLAFSLSTIKGNEETIIKSIIEMTGLNETLAESGITINYEVENWQNEINAFTKVIENLLKLFEENGIENISEMDLQKVLMDSSENPTTTSLIEAICESEMLSTSLIELLNKLFETANLQEWESDYFKSIIDGTIEISDTELKEEILILLDIFSDAKGLLEGDIENIDTESLKEVLYSMNDSKFIKIEQIISFLNDKVLDDESFGIEKKFVNPSLNKEEWKVEIDNLVLVLNILLDSDLLEGSASESIKGWDDTQKINDLLNALNNSKVFRQILPDLLMQVIPQEDYKTEWLESQCGVKNGVNNEVASIEEWKYEIVQITEIIKNLQNINLNDLDLSRLTDEQYVSLEGVLIAMNKTKSFEIDALIPSINNIMIQFGYSEILGVFDRNQSGSNEDEWEIEISRLIEITKLINEIGEVKSSSLETNAQKIGLLLDRMETSYLFGNDVRKDGELTVDDNCFNNIIIQTFVNLNLLKTTDNPNGFIDENKAKNTDWTIYSWCDELQILNSFDTTASVQTDDAIKALAESKIIRDFYDIASIINDKISGVKIDISTIDKTLYLTDYVNGGEPLENEQLSTRNWSKEIDDMNTIISIFTSGNTGEFKSGIESLIANSEGTLAVETAINIKTKLGSLWDLI